MRLELINTAKDPNENTTYEFYTIGKYKVEVSIHTTSYGVERKHISVTKDYSERYLPAIYFTGRRFGKDVNEFEIQTTSYGALKPEDIQKVMEGYEQALKVVSILTEELLYEG